MVRSLPILSERGTMASTHLVDCTSCTSCCEHGGLVYVKDNEVERLKHLKVPLLTIDGVSFIRRLPNGSCPMLNQEGKKCSIYHDRPLCCRLFPLDVLYIDGGLHWAISAECPDDKKKFEGVQGPRSKIGSASVARIASILDTLLDASDINFFSRKEYVSSRVKLFDEDQNDSWTPVVRLSTWDNQQAGSEAKKKEDETKKEKLKRKLEEKKKGKKRKKKKAGKKR